MAISTAVDSGAVARVLGIETVFKQLSGGIVSLPQRVAVIGQGNSLAVYSPNKAQYTSAFDVATVYGSGSPLHLAAKQLLPSNGDGIGTIPMTIYPLVDDGSAVAADATITPVIAATTSSTYRVRISNIDSLPFVITVIDTIATVTALMTAAINGVIDMPVVASDGTTQLDLVSKWSGVSANSLRAEVIGPTDTGNTFTVSAFVNGLVEPDITPALDQVGNVWETMILNCLDVNDEVNLNRYQNFGEGRWGSLVKKPCIVFTGQTEANRAAATAITDTRKIDRINVQLVAPGSNDLPLVVAAGELARIVKLANNNPPHDYGSQDVPGIIPGTDGEQWDYLDRDAAVKAGSSTIEVKDGVVNISDVVTYHHPDGDPTPAYRYVVDIVKLQNVIFNIDLEFASQEWDGAPLIPDNQPSSNRTAKKPRTAIATAAAITTSLGNEAILSDTAETNKGIQAGIDSANPKRLNMVIPVKLSGNTNIKSIDLEFGFFTGA